MLRLTTDAPLSYIAHETPFALTHPVTMILGPDEPLEASVDSVAREFLERTRNYWLAWVRGLGIPLDWQSAIIRAAITLKLCHFEETGAIIAAHTTSIPEAPGTQRNWDYRFCWLRDAYFVISALNRLGATQTMEAYLNYITTIAVDTEPPLQPVYGIIHNQPLDRAYRRPTSPASAAWGRCASATRRPSRRSTTPTAASSSARRTCSSTSDCRAWAMRRCSAASSRSGIRRGASTSSRTPVRGSTAAANASIRTRRPCAGSRATGWPRLAGLLSLDERAGYWRAHADKIRNEILRTRLERQVGRPRRRARPRRPRRQRAAGRRVRPAARQRRALSSAPCDVIGKELNRNGFIMRYVAEDDFGAPETAFLVCQFWYADALASIGEKEQGARYLHRRAFPHQFLRHPQRGHPPGLGRTVGQYPADLLHGRNH